jgi:hypothetical protein
MSNQLRASELLRQAANLLVSENSSTTYSESQSTPSVTTASIGSTTVNRKYDKQDGQGKAAFNERNPHSTQQ